MSGKVVAILKASVISRRKTMALRGPREIEGILRDETSWLRESIVRNVGDFTVALLAICDAPNERLELAGTGTLVESGGEHFILTGRHDMGTMCGAVKAFAFIWK
jgi:hypothetical protein